MELNGSSAFVTGGASGLGEAAARGLAAAGANVVIFDMDGDKGKAVAEDMGATFCQGDVASPEDVIAAIDLACGLGPLRAVVTSAGISIPARTIGRDGSYDSAFDLATYERTLRVNLVGTFNCIRLAATAIARTDPVDESGQRGAIVTVASAAAFDGQIGQAAYAASKGGVVGMVLPVARDLAVVGIRVNCIAPGLIDTPIYGVGEDAERWKSSLARDVLFPKRLGDPSDFASLALELLTNDYMNAEVIRLDAGARLQPK